MNKIFAFLPLLFFISCGGTHHKKILIELDSTSGVQTVLVRGAVINDSLKEEAKKLHIQIEGNSILKLTGDARNLTQLAIPVTDNYSYITDPIIDVVKEETPLTDFSGLYLARKEFRIEELQKTHPQADGRGVIVGVIDDGISPHQKGFQWTTTGERKLLSKGSNSSSTVYPLHLEDNIYQTTIKELRSFKGIIDINRDAQMKDFKATVSLDGRTVCLDLNLNDLFDENECRGEFDSTGEYFLIPSNPNEVLVAQVDLKNLTLKLFQSEKSGDSHGEGVASVMSGHNMGGIKGFDGVAPGSKILDYDLSQASHLATESEYTLGTFLLAIDWLASRGAKVINVSYSLYYTSARTQEFMAQALDDIVKKYNVIVSFSAGNNGPGLGSLNRRLIYPASTLVAGAYVSKELDERVHGVTGLPEEGRIVYYSSLGPGASGAGPLMIAPLSNLTYASPDDGLRAFSGTSSASPALAGAATVLVSALLQEGLPYDAVTVIHALKLSGRQIQGEPFIAQGYGLPQLDSALEIYRELIKGKEFTHIDVSVNQGNLDGATAHGIFIRRSQQHHETYRLNLRGNISRLAPTHTQTELVTPVRVEYSQGISGAKESWISSTSSRIHIDVNSDEVLNGKDEGFGEIRLYSQINNRLLTIIPVTVVNDYKADRNIRKKLQVNSQEGNRIHLHIPNSVKGVKVNARLLKGQRRILNFSTYNPHFIRTRQMAFTSEFILPVDRPGHYQIALLMAGGTASSAEVEFDIEPIYFEMESLSVSAKDAVIRFNNNSQALLQGDLLLTRLLDPIYTQVFNNTERGYVELEVTPGSYQVEMLATKKYDLSYLRQNCTILEKNGDQLLPTTSTIYQTKVNATIIVQCIPFDIGAKFSTKESWLMKVGPIAPTKRYRFDISSYSKKEINLGELKSGKYKVEFSSPFSTERILLGDLEVW
ncbi:MAG: S8 family serine peptidase [Candidatus Caldatribacteriota bacterium]